MTMKCTREEAIRLPGEWDKETGLLKRLTPGGHFSFGAMKIEEKDGQFLVKYYGNGHWPFDNFRELISGTKDFIEWADGLYTLETYDGGSHHKTLHYRIENGVIFFMKSADHQKALDDLAYFAPGRWLRD